MLLLLHPLVAHSVRPEKSTPETLCHNDGREASFTIVQYFAIAVCSVPPFKALECYDWQGMSTRTFDVAQQGREKKVDRPDAGRVEQ